MNTETTTTKKTPRGFVRWMDGDGYGNGTWGRKVNARCFHVINVIDMDEACGSDNAGQPKYVVELDCVDLDSIPTKTIQDAIRSCGWEDADKTDPRILAEICHEYGCKAPLHSVSCGSRDRGFGECRAESYSLTRDTEKLTAALSRPVNAIGSTALEYMQGDIHSAIGRGLQAGNQNAQIMAKMYDLALVSAKVSTIAIHNSGLDEASNGDPIAYSCGYMDAVASRPMPEPREDLAKAYRDGYRLGTEVRCGNAEKPSWIK